MMAIDTRLEVHRRAYTPNWSSVSRARRFPDPSPVRIRSRTPSNQSPYHALGWTTCKNSWKYLQYHRKPRKIPQLRPSVPNISVKTCMTLVTSCGIPVNKSRRLILRISLASPWKCNVHWTTVSTSRMPHLNRLSKPQNRVLDDAVLQLVLNSSKIGPNPMELSLVETNNRAVRHLIFKSWTTQYDCLHKMLSKIVLIKWLCPKSITRI